MIAVIYNDENKLKMENEFSSLKFQMLENIYLVKHNKDLSDYSIFVCDNSFDYSTYIEKNIILIISKINENIVFTNNIIMIQYESELIKKETENKYEYLKHIDNVVINCIPKQKLLIEPLTSQDTTIFFSGIDKPQNMVDEMFKLDEEVYYNIKFYGLEKDSEPSKLHRLSWNVTTDENFSGIISYKIIKEVENGCLPILLKENAPKYFFAYPFCITLEELKDKDLLIDRVKEMSSFIAKTSRDDYKSIANAIYNSVYVNSNWKYNFYLIAKKMLES